MPATFHVPMPNAAQRRQILSLILAHEPISEDVDVETIAKSTEGFSGSDLRELCRNAAVYRVRDFVRQEINSSMRVDGGFRPRNNSENEYHDALRPITMEDLTYSFNKMRDSKIQCGAIGVQPRIDLD